MKQTHTSILSIALSIFVVGILIFATPAQAVMLSTTLPSNAAAGSEVSFDLKAQIDATENIPVEQVTMTINGPSGSQVCVFEPDGTPVSGCDGISISQALPDETAAERYGNGWNGTADVNTTFGYGYGFGSQTQQVTLTWNVKWNTAGTEPGAYTVDYFVSAASESASRDYRIKESGTITLLGAAATPVANLYVKQPFPIKNNYVLVCNNTVQNARYSWHYGDGSKLVNISNGDTFHRYEAGEYTATCVAFNETTSVNASLQVSVAAAPIFATPVVKAPFPKGNDFVFVCENNLTPPVRYDWHFGDGSKLLDVANKDVFHRYAHNGSFSVSCTAHNDEGSASGTINVSVAQQEPAAVCASSFAELEATCQGGTITQESNDGSCRTVTCQNGGSVLKVKACEKPKQGAKKFEMYQQVRVGDGLKVCLGETCLEPAKSGFAKGKLEACHK